jgi:hypothetical protein
MSPILGVNPYLFIATTLTVLVIGGTWLYEHAQTKAAMRRHANRMADDPYWAGGE